MKSSEEYKICIEAANAFHSIALECFNGSVDSLLTCKVYPFVVNLTFACELYIKGLKIAASQDNQCEEGHYLDDLFSSLSDDVKLKVEELYDLECEQNLYEMLTENRRAFIEWRYAYEKNVRFCVSGMLAFSNSLKTVNKELSD